MRPLLVLLVIPRLQKRRSQKNGTGKFDPANIGAVPVPSTNQPKSQQGKFDPASIGAVPVPSTDQAKEAKQFKPEDVGAIPDDLAIPAGYNH